MTPQEWPSRSDLGEVAAGRSNQYRRSVAGSDTSAGLIPAPSWQRQPSSVSAGNGRVFSDWLCQPSTPHGEAGRGPGLMIACGHRVCGCARPRCVGARGCSSVEATRSGKLNGVLVTIGLVFFLALFWSRCGTRGLMGSRSMPGEDLLGRLRTHVLRPACASIGRMPAVVWLWAGFRNGGFIQAL